MWFWVDEQFINETEKWLPLHALSVQYGYGVFETIRLVEGNLLSFDAHYERLLAGCRATLLRLSYSGSLLKEFCLAVSQKNGMEHGVIKVSCFKNVHKDSVMILCRNNPYETKDFLRGFHIKISQYKRNPYSRLVRVKTNNYLENYLERQTVLQEGFDEVLFFNTDGMVSECSASNIFFIKAPRIYTPSIQTGILPGIMRAVILEKAKKSGITVKEGEFDREFLTTVDGAFVTNSIMGAMPVSRITSAQDVDMRFAIDTVRKYLDRINCTFPSVRPDEQSIRYTDNDNTD